MIEEIFKKACVRRRIAANHLSITLPSFTRDLDHLGYHPGSIRSYVRTVEHFGMWLKESDVPVRAINEQHVHEFLERHLSRCVCPKPAAKSIVNCRAALGVYTRFLRRRGFMSDPKEGAPRPTVIDRLVAEYDESMNQVCGLAPATRQPRRHYAGEFLKWRMNRQGLRLARLSPKDVRDFVTARVRTMTRPSGVILAGALRSFLRFLELSGRIGRGLSDAVPCRAKRVTDQPSTILMPEQYKRFLSCFDRDTPVGQRNYAMALCLSLLALRAGEVAELRLDDVNWRQMTVRLARTKQRKTRLMPLPDRLARALAKYLKDGRPQTKCRALFVCHRPPVGQALKQHQVRDVIRHAFSRCGVEASGTHILRRSWATWAHRGGAGLKMIADVLGHESLNSTTRYAQLNLEELRQAALPWPKEK